MCHEAIREPSVYEEMAELHRRGGEIDTRRRIQEATPEVRADRRQVDGVDLRRMISTGPIEQVERMVHELVQDRAKALDERDAALRRVALLTDGLRRANRRLETRGRVRA